MEEERRVEVDERLGRVLIRRLRRRAGGRLRRGESKRRMWVEVVEV